MFSQMINDTEHQWSRSPQDFVLYEIGTFDDSDTTIQSAIAEQIATGPQVKTDG